MSILPQTTKIPGLTMVKNPTIMCSHDWYFIVTTHYFGVLTIVSPGILVVCDFAYFRNVVDVVSYLFIVTKIYLVIHCTQFVLLLSTFLCTFRALLFLILSKLNFYYFYICCVFIFCTSFSILNNL